MRKTYFQIFREEFREGKYNKVTFPKPDLVAYRAEWVRMLGNSVEDCAYNSLRESTAQFTEKYEAWLASQREALVDEGKFGAGLMEALGNEYLFKYHKERNCTLHISLLIKRLLALKVPYEDVIFLIEGLV